MSVCPVSKLESSSSSLHECDLPTGYRSRVSHYTVWTTNFNFMSDQSLPLPNRLTFYSSMSSLKQLTRLTNISHRTDSVLFWPGYCQLIQWFFPGLTKYMYQLHRFYPWLTLQRIFNNRHVWSNRTFDSPLLSTVSYYHYGRYSEHKDTAA